MKRVTSLAAVITVAFVLGGCGSQGWSKTAGQTSCKDWATKLSSDDQQGLADSLFKLAQRYNDSIPGGAVGMETNLTSGCTAAHDSSQINIALLSVGIMVKLNPGN